jgi:hypothetical protein
MGGVELDGCVVGVLESLGVGVAGGEELGVVKVDGAGDEEIGGVDGLEGGALDRHLAKGNGGLLCTLSRLVGALGQLFLGKRERGVKGGGDAGSRIGGRHGSVCECFEG